MNILGADTATVTFEVGEIGRFTAVRELTLEAEERVRDELDRVLEGRYEELLREAERLQNEEDEEARAEGGRIIEQIGRCHELLRLEEALVNRPEGFGSVHDLSDEELFSSLKAGYERAVGSAVSSRIDRIREYLNAISNGDLDKETAEQLNRFENRELTRMRGSLLYWFRKKYNLAITDPRVKNLTALQLHEEYLEHVLEMRAQSAPLRETSVSKTEYPESPKDEFRQWTERIKADPSYFESWAGEMEQKLGGVLKRIGPENDKAKSGSVRHDAGDN